MPRLDAPNLDISPFPYQIPKENVEIRIPKIKVQNQSI